jgi:hypothetical protein
MREIIEMLQMNDWIKGDEYIQIAKGKYHYPSTFKSWIEKIKRLVKNKI